MTRDSGERGAATAFNRRIRARLVPPAFSLDFAHQSVQHSPKLVLDESFCGCNMAGLTEVHVVLTHEIQKMSRQFLGWKMSMEDQNSSVADVL
jgi:hypothetical protein